MLKYKNSKLFRQGIVGVVMIVCVILVGLQSTKFITLKTPVHYEAVFSEAGGLTAGADVIVSGMKVGTVSKISLRNGDAVATLSVDGKIEFGSESTAHVRTGSLLGKRIVTIESQGSGSLKPRDTIPVERTGSPYSLTDAVSELTTNAAGIDTDQLNQSLDTLTATLDSVAPELGPTFDGLTAVSRALNARNESLRDLLKTTADVSGILGERSERVNSLILNANLLVGVLNDRRQAISTLLANTNAVALQLSGLVADNEAELGPTLDRLNSVSALLERQRDNINTAIPGLGKVALTQGEAISGGAFYNAYVANLALGPLIQPFIDQAFGLQPAAPFPLPHLETPR
ncbi:MCE family protein [Aldersonia sp. NBC_00410]|uniref:MCE family protein n=1 Tax=Aldersonia sp. NBC_00410 TaxID=2975954 RepID=UPI00224D1B1D|nr:MCE family protein [Aldersonia sp. NBC_00410]MCX5044279.1 MCE family protein [Aldersonia sp. NBC_00410]